jgi:hypothetical protein
MSETPPNTPDGVHQEYIVAPLTRTDIRSISSFYKDTLGKLSSGEEKVGIVFFLDALLPNVVPGFRLTTKAISEMGNYLGLAKPSENEIWVREDIYESACSGTLEAEKVLAHEFGHFCLHRNVKFPKVADAKTPKECNAEWQADVFADYLLGVTEKQLELFEEI